MHNGKAVGIGSNTGSKLLLWQDGYELNYSIEVFVAPDGTYSASLFSGQYKMTRKGGAPWQNQPNDTLLIDVKGNTVFDVPVTPYLEITDTNFEKQGNSINTTFSVNEVVENSVINEIYLYLGTKVLLDNGRYSERINLSGVTLNELTNMQIEIPESLQSEEYLFMRIGVKSNFSNEYYFTDVQKIFL